MRRIKVIDSHTGGEPTRIIIEGGPALGSGSLVERVERFRNEFDGLRSATVNEPRGSDVLVGGLLCEPTKPDFDAGIIFFNNASYLGMCGHGTIGLMATLKHLGKLEPGKQDYKIETPVGSVTASIKPGSGNDKDSIDQVSVRNVMSYRLLADVKVDVPDYGTVVGDVAWGGNWFFLVKDTTEELVVKNTDHLTRVTKRIRQALADNGIEGTDGIIDHIELLVRRTTKKMTVEILCCVLVVLTIAHHAVRGQVQKLLVWPLTGKLVKTKSGDKKASLEACSLPAINCNPTNQQTKACSQRSLERLMSVPSQRCYWMSPTPFAWGFLNECFKLNRRQ